MQCALCTLTDAAAAVLERNAREPGTQPAASLSVPFKQKHCKGMVGRARAVVHGRA